MSSASKFRFVAMSSTPVYDALGEALTAVDSSRGAIVLTGPIDSVRELAPHLFRDMYLHSHGGSEAKLFLIAFLRWLNANPHQVERLQALRRDLEMDELGALDLVDELVKRSVAEGTPI